MCKACSPPLLTEDEMAEEQKPADIAALVEHARLEGEARLEAARKEMLDVQKKYDCELIGYPELIPMSQGGWGVSVKLVLKPRMMPTVSVKQ